MVVVQEPDGNLHDALVRDEAGNPFGSLDVRLELTETDQIVIRPGVPAAFSLDFDLDASNEIDFSAAPPIVTVRPFLLAAAELEADRAHRLRGLLDGVDEAEGVVTIDMRPFRHRRGNFGSMSFAVTPAKQPLYDANAEPPINCDHDRLHTETQLPYPYLSLPARLG